MNKSLVSKYTANGIFLFISSMLIASMLVQLSDNIFNKIVLVILAIGLDLFSQYVIALGKHYYANRRYVLTVIMFTVYAFYASVVIISTIGFAIGEVGMKDKGVEIVNLKEKQAQADILLLHNDIERLNKIRDTYTNYSWRYRDISVRIDKLQAKKQYLLNTMTNKHELNVSKDVYDNLGEAVNITGDRLKIYTFFIIAIFLVIALLITSWDLKTEQKKPKEQLHDDKEKIALYIDAMMAGREDTCNSDAKISEHTKLPIHECNRYRAMLLNMKLGGKQVLLRFQGVTKLMVDKEQLKKAILNA